METYEATDKTLVTVTEIPSKETPKKDKAQPENLSFSIKSTTENQAFVPKIDESRAKPKEENTTSAEITDSFALQCALCKGGKTKENRNCSACSGQGKLDVSALI